MPANANAMVNNESVMTLNDNAMTVHDNENAVHDTAMKANYNEVTVYESVVTFCCNAIQ